MAPRSAKTKKTSETKVTENDAPKKGRGRGKNTTELEPELEAGDVKLNEKAIADKKPKRGRKPANDITEIEANDETEVAEPPVKKGRKKNVGIVQDKVSSNGDDSAEEDSQEETNKNGDSNGHVEDIPSSGKGGGKKPAKKGLAQEKPLAKPGRGRKAKQEVNDNTETSNIDIDDKPKSATKGRGRKAKVEKVEGEPEASKSDIEEEVKQEPVAKGRKKASAKAAPKKLDNDVEEEKDTPEEEKPEPKKKDTKVKKNQGKKVQEEPEDDVEQAKEDAPSSKKRKVNKKEDKATGNSNNDEGSDEIVSEVKAKGKRGQKKAADTTETDEDPQDTSEPTTKRKRKAPEEKAPKEEKKTAAKNKSITDFNTLDFSNTSRSNQGKDWNFKISSWNVDGIRAWMSKGCLDYLQFEKPDILCLQEVKCSQDKLPSELTHIPGYHAYWLAGDKDGYAGVGIYTTKLAISVTYGLQNEELDSEGRIITAEYEQFYLVCTYVPNAGRKLVTLPKRLKWNEEFRKFVKELDKKKPVIICGDMNVSHKEIDLTNPKTNRKNAGFTDEERAGMSALLGDGFVDTYRHLYPDNTGAYTFWTYMMNCRAKNVGWRLDYFIVSERLLPSLCDNVIREKVYGSDHCPITLFLHLTSADKPKE